MGAHERLSQIIDERQGRLAASVPPDREAALLALLRLIDRLPLHPDAWAEPDLVTGRRVHELGVPTALRLCLDAPAGRLGVPGDPDDWARDFLDACRQLEAAALVARFAETGAMRLAERDDGGFDAWLAGGRVPALWRERADIDWWAGWLAHREAEPGDRLGASRPADALVERMRYQFGYPPDDIVGGCPVRLYRAVLAEILTQALDERASGRQAAPVDERALAASVAAAVGADAVLVRRALSALTLDRASAAWHAALPGGPQAPLVRLDGVRLVWSVRGLLSEPLFFAGRELRRLDPEGYHNAAHLREGVFRQDLYALFADRRFAASAARIVLRDADRRTRTDIDAAIFDRKTGTLALFELKSQDPFARTAEELVRQRDNLRRAGHQVAAVLDWMNRHGADDLLNRVDPATAKRFRVHRVLPFVLGRYVADPDAGAPTGRVAWGSWPQVLRLMDGAQDANPLLALHARLGKDAGVARPPATGTPATEIRLGEARLVVHASWAAVEAARGAP
jgi:hypothetical protein